MVVDVLGVPPSSYTWDPDKLVSQSQNNMQLFTNPVLCFFANVDSLDTVVQKQPSTVTVSQDKPC